MGYPYTSPKCMKRVMCDHEWVRFEDVPCGEDTLKHWQCSKCGVVGYRKHHGYGSRKTFQPKVFMCHVKGCSEQAIGRVRGRTSVGRLRWACKEHLSV